MNTRFTTRLFILATGVFVVAWCGLQAQPADSSQHWHAPSRMFAGGPSALKFKGLRDQLHVWAQKEVVPTLREWKSEFDASMSAGDLSTLNSLRSQAADLRHQRLQLMPTMRKQMMAVRDGDLQRDDPEVQSSRDQMQAISEKQRELMTQVKTLAQKYQPSLHSLRQKAQPKIELWVASATQQAQDYAKENNVRLGRFAPEWMAMAIPRFMADTNARFHHEAAARFLLWDGGSLLDTLGNPGLMMSAPENKTNPSMSFSLSQNVPNPVTGASTTISFSLQQADHVRMTLVDDRGEQVAVICDKNYPAGQNFVEFPLAALANGSYTYRMVCGQGTLSNSMTILR